MAKKLAGDGGIREIILADGSKRYEARVHRRGEASKERRFNTKREAVAWKRKIDTAIDGGAPVLSTKTVLISTVVDDFLAYKSESSTPLSSNKVTDFERIRMDLGDLAVRNIDRPLVENYIAMMLKEPIKRDAHKPESELRKTYAPATVRKFFFALKQAIAWHSYRNGYFFDASAFELERGTVPDAWSGSRERRLAPGEEERLYDAGIDAAHTFTREDWRAVIGFALETAMREQEIVFARWIDVSPDGRKLRVPKKHSKTKRDRVILLSPAARIIIEKQRTACPKSESRIFYQWPSPDSLCASFARLTERAGIEDLHFHDLRHEATSRICEGGKLPTMAIMETTGHTNMTTFQKYLHLIKAENALSLD